MQGLPDFVALVDRQRRVVWSNRAEAQGASALVALEAFLPPAGSSRAKAAIDAAFESAAVACHDSGGQRAGTGEVWYALRVIPIGRDVADGSPGDSVESVLLVALDVTGRRRAERALRETEAQLQRAQRLESVGQLAGGIAHDFNNLLQVIDGNLALARQALKAGERPIDELEHALRATERVAEITSHLLAIGRRKRVDAKRVDLGALVGHSVLSLRTTLPENVTLSYAPPAVPQFVALDAPQFEQVLLNLYANARDAMPDGGALSVQVEAEGKAHVSLSVSDTGRGIAPENLDQVFEPFFTTKSSSSGLGLAVAAGIVAAHGGLMLAESDGRTGTTIKVQLPCAAQASETTAPDPSAAGHGSGTILVADDEEPVRLQLERTLSRAGYDVLQASTGRRALELFREHQAEIDLVILDVVMPELDGWRAFLAMAELVPDVKVLFATGYAASVLPQDFAARGARLLSKPYKAERLLEQVGELLHPSSLRPSVPRIG